MTDAKDESSEILFLQEAGQHQQPVDKLMRRRISTEGDSDRNDKHKQCVPVLLFDIKQSCQMPGYISVLQAQSAA